MTDSPAWRGTRDRLTVDDVRARCADLPPPQRRAFGHDVREPKPAATLVPITDLGGEAAVVVTRRPSTMTYHRGEWVFPGGRFDPASDVTLVDTARREAREELGIPDGCMEILGELDSHGPILTGFVVHAFVGIIAAGARLAPDPTEVDEALVIPLGDLTAEGVYREAAHIPDHEPGPPAAVDAIDALAALSSGEHGPVRFFRIRDGEDLWGTQAEILCNLLEHLGRNVELSDG